MGQVEPGRVSLRLFILKSSQFVARFVARALCKLALRVDSYYMLYVLEMEDAILTAPITVFTQGRFSKRGPLDFDFRVKILRSARDHSRHVPPLAASLIVLNSFTDG